MDASLVSNKFAANDGLSRPGAGEKGVSSGDKFGHQSIARKRNASSGGKFEALRNNK